MITLSISSKSTEAIQALKDYVFVDGKFGSDPYHSHKGNKEIALYFDNEDELRDIDCIKVANSIQEKIESAVRVLENDSNSEILSQLEFSIRELNPENKDICDSRLEITSSKAMISYISSFVVVALNLVCEETIGSLGNGSYTLSLYFGHVSVIELLYIQKRIENFINEIDVETDLEDMDAELWKWTLFVTTFSIAPA